MEDNTFFIGLCKFTCLNDKESSISCPSVDFMVTNNQIAMKLKSNDGITIEGNKAVLTEKEMIVEQSKQLQSEDKNVQITEIVEKPSGNTTTITIEYNQAKMDTEDITSVTIRDNSKLLKQYKVNKWWSNGIPSSTLVTDQLIYDTSYGYDDDDCGYTPLWYLSVISHNNKLKSFHQRLKEKYSQPI